MHIDSNFFIHDLDKAALQALKAIPGFTQLLKAFMKVWNEQLFNIENMSTNLRLSEKQLPQYYNLLPPICEKLGIDVPDMYLELDVNANAYTYGDTKPFIVLTSGLIETLPDELIATVIAHECGHIACRHTLYKTMGRMLLNGASDVMNLFGLGDVVMLPIKAAFWHWSRCSEYSADRAAMVCDGNADKMIEVCLRFSGLDKDIAAEANVEAFMEQAVEYKKLVGDNKVNKAMELLMFLDNSHPLNAVRAYECNEWQKSNSFTNLRNYMDAALPASCEQLPLVLVSDQYVGMDYQAAASKLRDAGFMNVELIRRTQSNSKKDTPAQVVEIAINGKVKFEDADWYPRTSIIEVIYYLPESDEEISAAHPGQIQLPNSSKGYAGKDCAETAAEFKRLGFTDISTYEQEGPKLSWPRKENSIARITINGQSQFDMGDWVGNDATIRITYNTFSK